MAVDAPTQKPNAFKTAVDTIVAPKDAFEAIKVVPTWGIALAIAIVLTALGTYLTIPAVQHAMAASWPAQVASNPQLSQMSPDKQQQMLEFSQKGASFAWIFVVIVVPIYCLVEALIFLIFDKLGRGEGSYAKYFAASCNIAIPAAGLSAIINGIVVMARGAETFSDPNAINRAVPSLAMLVPATGKLAAFLGTFTPFTIWATGLSILAILIIGRVPKLQAWLAGIVLFLIPSLLAVAFAK